MKGIVINMEKINLEQTGKRIASLRRERGYTGEGLAEMLGVSPRPCPNGRTAWNDMFKDPASWFWVSPNSFLFLLIISPVFRWSMRVVPHFVRVFSVYYSMDESGAQ